MAADPQQRIDVPEMEPGFRDALGLPTVLGSCRHVDPALALTCDELHTRIQIMMWTERSHVAIPNYIESVQQDGMRAMWRMRICEWLIEFVAEFSISIDTVATAINYIDRYLSKVSTKKCILQLVALAAIFIAAKFHEEHPIAMKEIQGLAEGMYLEMDIRLMEQELLHTLEWNINPVTPHCLMRHFALLAKDLADSKTLEELCCHADAFLDIILCEYTFVRFKPSVLSAAALLCAFETTQTSPYVWVSEMNAHYKLLRNEHIHECKSLMIESFKESFPEYYREKFLVSPDCVADIEASTTIINKPKPTN